MIPLLIAAGVGAAASAASTTTTIATVPTGPGEAAPSSLTGAVNPTGPLAELTAANIKLALGSTQTITTTASGASQHGFEDLKAGGEIYLPEYQLGFEGYTLDSLNHQMPVRLFVYRANFVLNGALSFAKKAAAGIPLQVQALADTGKTAGQQLINFQRVTAWQTS